MVDHSSESSSFYSSVEDNTSVDCECIRAIINNSVAFFSYSEWVMRQLANIDADGEVQSENGIVDEKQPLNNGRIADRALIIESLDQTDSVHIPRIDNEKPTFFHKNSKRKYRTYDTGKRNCRPVKLAPLKKSGMRIEERLMKKTGLTRSGLILAILWLLTTIIAIVFFILWLKSDSLKNVCRKPSCLRSSAEVTSLCKIFILFR